MTSYVRDVLHADAFYQVDDLDDMFSRLGAIGHSKKVSRIRIVGHGSHDAPHKKTGGKVLLHHGGVGHWITPDEVLDFARRHPEEQALVRKVMQPGAVVEFWGCSLGGYPKAARAWATLFQSNVVATPWKVMDLWEGDVRIPTAHEGEKPQIAKSSADIDRVGKAYSAQFDQALVAIYKTLTRSGEMKPIAGGDDPKTVIAHMRAIFDRSSGRIWSVGVRKGKKDTITPKDQESWNAAWKTFSPIPLDNLVIGGEARQAVPAGKDPAPAGHPIPGSPAMHGKQRKQGARPGATGTTGDVDASRKRRTQQLPSTEAVIRQAPGDWVFWNFAIGSAALRPAHMRGLEEVASQLAADPQASLVIDGHASRSGSMKTNDRLSAQRAETVRNSVVSKLSRTVSARTIAHGSQDPWDPAADPIESAHDRRVEVRIQRGTAAITRAPLEAPRVGPVTTATTIPQVRLSDLVPGYYLERKFDAAFPPVEAGPIVIYPALEFSGRIELATAMNAKGWASWSRGSWEKGLAATVGDVEFKANLTKGLISGKFNALPLKPEIGLAEFPEILSNPSKLLKPVTLKFTLGEKVWPLIDLGAFDGSLAGIKVNLRGAVKGKFDLGPSKRLMISLGSEAIAAVGETGIIVGGSILGAAAWTYASLKLIEHEHEAGRRWAAMINRRSGFAWRISVEAAEWRERKPGESPQSGASTHFWEEAKAHVRRFRESGELAYALGFEGWTAAEAAIKSTEAKVRDATLKRLQQKYSRDLKAMQRAVMVAEGGFSHEEHPLPSDLRFLGL